VGFEVVDTPPAVHSKLAAAVDKALEDWDGVRSEGKVTLRFFLHGDDRYPPHPILYIIVIVGVVVTVMALTISW
jgi:hypothetical protein